jgi:hypothetical protein
MFIYWQSRKIFSHHKILRHVTKCPNSIYYLQYTHKSRVITISMYILLHSERPSCMLYAITSDRSINQPEVDVKRWI